MTLRAPFFPSRALREQLERDALDDEPRDRARRIRAHLGIHSVGEADDALVLKDRGFRRSRHAVTGADRWQRLDHETSATDGAVAATVTVASRRDSNVRRDTPHRRTGTPLLERAVREEADVRGFPMLGLGGDVVRPIVLHEPDTPTRQVGSAMKGSFVWSGQSHGRVTHHGFQRHRGRAQESGRSGPSQRVSDKLRYAGTRWDLCPSFRPATGPIARRGGTNHELTLPGHSTVTVAEKPLDAEGKREELPLRSEEH